MHLPLRFSFINRIVIVLASLTAMSLAAVPVDPQQSLPKPTMKAVAKYPDLGKAGSPFNTEFLRRLKIRIAENPQFATSETWALSLADEVAGVIDTYATKPEIEFKVLLIIKRYSDTSHPLFLPIRAAMTEEEIQTARHCFEIQTPDMVHDATYGKVRFTPTVVVSDKPLRCLDPKRRDSAEYMGDELVNELATLSKPGEYDSVGYYFLHYDTALGYRAPRAGYGVGGYDGRAGIGMFAVSCVSKMNPRDEIFLHEWMHGLDGFYGGKKDVRLPTGQLHGKGNYDAHYNVEKAWRPQDTFKGYMEWYRDILNCQVPERDGFSGLGSNAWKYGPLREEGRKRGSKFPTVNLPTFEYPKWAYELMKGDLTHAVLEPNELVTAVKSGAITADQTPWRLESWAKSASTKARYAESDGGIFTLECEKGDHAAIAQGAAVQPLANYVFIAEVKTTRVEIVEAGGRYSVLLEAGDSRSSKDFTGTSEWTRVVLPFTTKPDQTTVTLRLQMGGRFSLATGRAQFRNVMLQRIGAMRKP